MKRKEQKKKYKKPKITLHKKIEILAAVCSSGWASPSVWCRTAGDGCDFIQD